MTQTNTEIVENGLETGIETVKKQTTFDQMELIALSSLALHLRSLEIDFTDLALEEIFHLFCLHINSTLSDLSKTTQVQRRSKVAPKDVKILFKDHAISINELEDELIRNKRIPTELLKKKAELNDLANSVSNEDGLIGDDREEEELNPQDPSFVFFAHNEDLSSLIPSSHKRGKAIPSWLPQFPPDHSYLRTPIYTNRVTDQKVVRTMIAEESKSGEKALDHLIKFDNEVNHKNQDVHIGDDKSDDSKNRNLIKFSEEEKQVLWPSGLNKRLDIVKYSQARIKYLERKRQMNQLKESKIDHKYLRTVIEFSCYSTEKYPTSLEVSPQEYIESKFNAAFESLASLKKRKNQREEERIKLQKEEDQKRDQIKAAKMLENPHSVNTGTTEDNEMNDFSNFENFGEPNFENFGNNDEDDDDNDGGLFNVEQTIETNGTIANASETNNEISTKATESPENADEGSDIEMINSDEFEDVVGDDNEIEMVDGQGQESPSDASDINFSEFGQTSDNTAFPSKTEDNFTF